MHCLNVSKVWLTEDLKMQNSNISERMYDTLYTLSVNVDEVTVDIFGWV